MSPDPIWSDFFAPPPALGLACAFVWGALWGSFLNVVIFRLPRGLSVVRPASHCPTCGHPIRAWDNIPILSWLLLLGRCRDCRARISPRYPLVEGITAVLSTGVYARLVLGGPAAPYMANLAAYLVYFAFSAALVAVIFIDIDHQIVPNEITLGGIVVGFACSFLIADLHWWESLAGILCGGGVVVLLILGYARLRGIQGMGGGDAKLLAMIGAFLGWRSLLFVLLVASLLGLAAALLLGWLRKLTGSSRHLYDPATLQEHDDEPEAAPDGAAASVPEAGQAPPPAAPAPLEMPLHRTAIAFGPYLAVAAIAYLLVGNELIAWYSHCVGWLAMTLIGG